MGIPHIIIISLLVVVIYLVWPAKKGYSALYLDPEACGKGLPVCPAGERCFISNSTGKGECFQDEQPCGNGYPACPIGEKCFKDLFANGHCVQVKM